MLHFKLNVQDRNHPEITDTLYYSTFDTNNIYDRIILIVLFTYKTEDLNLHITKL